MHTRSRTHVSIAALGIMALACSSGPDNEPVTTPAPPAPPEVPAPPPAPSGLEIPSDNVATDLFEVLDIGWDSGKVAFRQIYHLVGEENCDNLAVSVACGYAGMDDHPTSGVILGLWDAKADRLEASWEVYPAAASKEACAAPEVSEQRLAEAKAAFAAAGLDPEARPAPVALAELGLASSYDSAFIEGSASSFQGALKVSKGDAVVHQREREFNGAMASRGTFEVTKGWADGKRVILEEDWAYQCNFECCADASARSFSPVLALGGGASGEGKGKGKSKR